MRAYGSAALFMLAWIGMNFWGGTVQAQTSAPPPPVRTYVDSNGVDLLTGGFALPQTLMSIGQPDAGMSLEQSFVGSAVVDNITGTINKDFSGYRISVGTSSDLFAIDPPGNFTFTIRGATLTATDTQFVYTMRDGTVATFSKALASNYPLAANTARLVKLVRPNGEELNYNYYTYNQCIPSGQSCTNVLAHGLQSVVSSLGYQLNLPWESSPTLVNKARAVTLNKRDGLITFNATYNADNTSSLTVTYPSGRTVVYARNSAQRVTSVTSGTAVWTYTYSDSGDERTVVAIDPNAHKRTIVSSIANVWVKSDTDDLNNVTSIDYKPVGLIEKITLPEQNYVKYTYDGRGNIVEKRIGPKDHGQPGAAPDIVITAGYDTTCVQPKTCNKPNWVKDARGAQTDFTYDPQHGGLLTVTAPAGRNGVRPQTRYGYNFLHAWYTQDGVLAEGAGIWKLTSISSCANGEAPACVGTSDETLTTITYGSPGVANNLLPTTVVTRSGNTTGAGALSATKAYAYDEVGNVTSIAGPLSGDANITYMVYDARRRLIGTIGADPDGGGSRNRPAVHTVYDDAHDGQITLQEIGVTASTTSVNGLSVLQSVALDYDARGRKIKERVVSGGATQRVIQYQYDQANLLLCSAFRMNKSLLGSPPSLACDKDAAGVDGEDRITRFYYDSLNRITSVISGYGVAPRTEMAREYTANGELAWVRDGENNLTSYVYDTFDRLKTIRLPVTGKGANSSDNNQTEQYGYDANGNLNSLTLRDGQVITALYDDLNRVYSKSSPSTEYNYDNFGRERSVKDVVSQRTFTSVYDALGRLKTSTGPIGSLDYDYDIAGRRTKVTWPDGVYVGYHYYNDDQVQNILLNDSADAKGLVAEYTYDSWSRRLGVTRANGVATAYGYDDALNLSSVAHSFPNSADNVTFSLRSNVAGQRKDRTISNSAYLSPGRTAMDRTFLTGGDNRLISSNPTGAPKDVDYSYDARGNLASDGSNTYAYDVDDHLTSAGGGSALVYDSKGRLYQTTIGGTVTRYLYDGRDLVGEYSASNQLVRRYVHGPGDNEPLIWYDTDVPARWLLADDLGSIVATTNSVGSIPISSLSGMKEIGTYDEYGRPGPTNRGAFQYTGQIWLSDISLYYYGARMYSPMLGRFMQPDPVGYADGLNWYTYAANDPVNRADPSGLDNEVGGVVVSWCRECQERAKQAFGDILNDQLRAVLDAQQTLQQISDYLRSPPSNPTQCALNLAKGGSYGMATGGVIGGVAGAGAVGALTGGGGAPLGAIEGAKDGSALGALAGATIASATAACHGGGGGGGGGGTQKKEFTAPNKAKVGDRIDTSKFTDRVRKAGAKADMKDPESGYSLSPERNPQSHGGSKWKLVDRRGTAIYSVSPEGDIMRAASQ